MAYDIAIDMLVNRITTKIKASCHIQSSPLQICFEISPRKMWKIGRCVAGKAQAIPVHRYFSHSSVYAKLPHCYTSETSSTVSFNDDVVVYTHFDTETATAQHIVANESTKSCAIIDPVLNYNMFSGKISTECATQLLDLISQRKYKVDWILETHVHADHITASEYLKKYHKEAKIAINEQVKEVQKIFSRKYNMKIACDGSQFDYLLKDGEEIKIGKINLKLFGTPGHTPACMSFYMKDHGAVFVGDTIFMPDHGSARCDFPGGSPELLWNSMHKLLSLPNHTVMFMCHDYKGPSGDRPYRWLTTVEEEKRENVHVKTIGANSISQDEFLGMRKRRDAVLSVPRLLHPALQFNMMAGHPPAKEAHGPYPNESAFVKIPLDLSSYK